MYNNYKRLTIICPHCGQPTKVKFIPGVTHLTGYPLWCQKCKFESVVDFDGASLRPSSPEPTA